MYWKLIQGCVWQKFDDKGKCIYQEFVEDIFSDHTYEDEEGGEIEEPENPGSFPIVLPQP